MEFIRMLPKAVGVAALLASSYTCAAAGTVPVRSTLFDSFDCQSGSSVQASYSTETKSRPGAFELRVNGLYVQKEPRLVHALRGGTIEQLRGSCQGDKTFVLIQVSNAGRRPNVSWISVAFNRMTELVSVGA